MGPDERGDLDPVDEDLDATGAAAMCRERRVATICMIRQGYYPLDPRVTRQAKALASMGHDVDVLCMRRPGEPLFEQANGVRVCRLPMRRHRQGKVTYLVEYAAFFVAVAALISARQLLRRYAVVQVNSPPDTLVFAALVPKLCGARVVLDLVETMPEFFATKFDVPLESFVCRAIARAEQLSIRFSDVAITCTEQQKEGFVRRGTPSRKIGIVLNSSDESVFDGGRYAHRGRDDDRFTLICHGSIEPRYGHDTVIRALALLKDDIPGLRFVVYGEGSAVPDLKNLVGELDLADRVSFHGYVPMHELLTAISDADFGVVAMTRDAFRDVTHCHKMYDFIAMGVPVLMSRTRSVEAYFPPTCFKYFESGDPADLARAIRDVERNPALAKDFVEHAGRISVPYRWDAQRAIYLDLVEPLLGRRRSDRHMHSGLSATRS